MAKNTGCTLLVLALLCGGQAWGSGPRVRVLTDAERRIEETVGLESAEEREAVLYAAIHSGLIESDLEVCVRVYTYLARITRWVDLYPYREILFELQEQRGINGPRVLDFNQLWHSSRETKAVLFRTAILEGSAALSGGSPLARETAMELASLEGFDELLPLIREYHQQLGKQTREGMPLERLEFLMSLTGGASDSEDAIERAMSRLAAADPQELRQSMDHKQWFRNTVLRLVERACEQSPIDGAQNPGCRFVPDIYAPQRSLAEAEAREARKSGERPAIETAPHWLDTLRTHGYRGKSACASRSEQAVDTGHQQGGSDQ